MPSGNLCATVSTLCLSIAAIGCGSSGSTANAPTGNTGQGGTGNVATNAGGSTTTQPGSSGGASTSGGWLKVEGNRILLPNGTRFHGRGANTFDTRQCGACAWADPLVDEWIRRLDVLIDQWHANFIRFNLLSFASANYQGTALAQWGDITQDANYLADVVKMVNHIGTKPGVYVLLTLFEHPSFTESELPTSATMPVYTKLAQTFLNSPHVLYGVTNEPNSTTDEAVWTAMNNAVQALRAVEPANGPHHVIAVQGTQEWARTLDYYVSHPITAGGGVNIVYETHAYNPQPDWQDLFLTPAKTIPVIIGEFGPDTLGYMSLADAKALMPVAEANEIPYIAWAFTQQNPPGLVANGSGECDANWNMAPSEWGTALKTQLGRAW